MSKANLIFNGCFLKLLDHQRPIGSLPAVAGWLEGVDEEEALTDSYILCRCETQPSLD